MNTTNQFRSSERGEGQIGSIIMLGVFIALAIGASQVRVVRARAGADSTISLSRRGNRCRA